MLVVEVWRVATPQVEPAIVEIPVETVISVILGLIVELIVELTVEVVDVVAVLGVEVARRALYC